MNFTDLLNDKEEFTQRIKDELNQRAFSELDALKQQMANDFMKEQEQE